MQLLNSSIHPKINNAIVKLIVDSKASFWGEFALFLDIRRDDLVGTAGVYYKDGRLKMDYCEEFIDSLSIGEVVALVVHELQHLLLGHCGIRSEGYDPKIANIAQDMIINEGIVEDSDRVYSGLDMSLPDCGIRKHTDYTGEMIFEPLYRWLVENADKYPEIGDGGEGGMDNHDKMNGESVPQEVVENLVDSIVNELKAGGKVTADIEKRLTMLRKRPASWLAKLKGYISVIKGSENKKRTIRRRHRMGYFGIKGKVKTGQYIGVILDVSGSMAGDVEKCLGTLLRNGLQVKLILADSAIKDIIDIKSQSDVKDVKLKGFGGTELQPAIDYYKKNMKDVPVAIMTDGFCDKLDVQGLSKVLVLSTQARPKIVGKHSYVEMR